MSKDSQKTYDGQTAKFSAVILQNLTNIPSLNSEVMQRWIENPLELKRMLAHALSGGPRQTAHSKRRLGFKGALPCTMEHDIEIPSDAVHGRGIDLNEHFKIELRFGIEYAEQAHDHKLILRPWLYIGNKHWGAVDEIDFHIRSKDFFANHEKFKVGFGTGLPLSLLQEETTSLSQVIDELEMDYADRVQVYMKQNFTFGVSVDENPTDKEWEISVKIFKDGASFLVFRFGLAKQAHTDVVKKIEEYIAEDARKAASTSS